MIRFDVVTLFPEMFTAITGSGITSRALEAGLYSLTTWNPRDFTTDRYRTVDDRPYGGGPGMVMLAEPLERVLDAVRVAGGGKVFYLTPQGRKLDHRRVMELAQERELEQEPPAGDGHDPGPARVGHFGRVRRHADAGGGDHFAPFEDGLGEAVVAVIAGAGGGGE